MLRADKPMSLIRRANRWLRRIRTARAADAEPLTGAVAAYLNLDMVGRLARETGDSGHRFFARFRGRRSATECAGRIGTSARQDKHASADRRVLVCGTRCADSVGLHWAHEDYHTPRDTPDKLNYDGAAKVAQLFALIARGILTASEPPEFKLEEGEIATGCAACTVDRLPRHDPRLCCRRHQRIETKWRCGRRACGQSGSQGRRHHHQAGGSKNRRHLRLHLRHRGPQNR